MKKDLEGLDLGARTTWRIMSSRLSILSLKYLRDIQLFVFNVS